MDNDQPDKRTQIGKEPLGTVSTTTNTRMKWDKKIDFLLSCIGFAVGLGNIWRFPYLCYKNGGGAFFVPYVIFMVFGGIPLFMLEVSIGQFMSYGGIEVWKICPIFKGIGLATTVISFWLSHYYIIIIALALLYFFKSFNTTLPWSHCGNDWNTPNCTEFTNDNFTFSNDTDDLIPTSPVTEFWERELLQISDGLWDAGGLRWELVGTLLLAWIVVYFCIWKGVRSTGKVVYFTATFPYVVLTILLIRGLCLEGAADGLVYYLYPDLTRLADTQVWIDAGTQVFFSYAIGLGALTALGSYNQFNNNCYRDTFIVAIVNSFTSFYGGLVIFTVLGYMANEQGVPIEDVATKGPGLVFIAYPKAVSLMPLAPFWSCLFFFMILLVGLDSQFVGVEGFVTAVVDLFPVALNRGYNRELFVLATCVESFIFGLTMVTRGGMYVFQIYDYFSASGMVLLCMSFFECVAIAWCYGGDKFYDNMEVMIGYRPATLFLWCWKYITPGISLALWLFTVVKWKPLVYNEYMYPALGEGIGLAIALSSMMCIPGWAIYSILRTQGTIKERWQKLTTPSLKPHQLQIPASKKDNSESSKSEEETLFK